VATVVSLEIGADARGRNGGAPLAAVPVNGGPARAVPGTWSATSELLACELAPRSSGNVLLGMRYRLEPWNELERSRTSAPAIILRSSS
jgi:hypothetical protein